MYDAYSKNGESFIATQPLFRQNFNVGQHGEASNHKIILPGVRRFGASGSLVCIKSPGPQPTVWTSDNVEKVKAVVGISPTVSVRRHVQAL